MTGRAWRVSSNTPKKVKGLIVEGVSRPHQPTVRTRFVVFSRQFFGTSFAQLVHRQNKVAEFILVLVAELGHFVLDAGVQFFGNLRARGGMPCVRRGDVGDETRGAADLRLQPHSLLCPENRAYWFSHLPRLCTEQQEQFVCETEHFVG